MRFKILGTYAILGLSVVSLSWILQPYAFTVRFWDIGLIFSTGGATFLMADILLKKRKPFLSHQKF